MSIQIVNNIIGMCATNTYYVYDEESMNCVLVDPAGDAARIMARVDKLGVKVCGILLTHGHFDHILAVPELKEHYQVQVLAGENERKVLRDPMMNLSGAWTDTPLVLEADRYLSDGEVFTLGGMSFRALETPGHTPGGMCYYMEVPQFLISGDTLFCESVGRTDFMGGSQSALVRSIREQLFALPDETKVFPGHGDFTTIGDEKRYNPYVFG